MIDGSEATVPRLSVLKQLAAAILLTAIALGAGAAITRAFEQIIPERTDELQHHYHRLPQWAAASGKKLVYWTELGRQGTLSITKVPAAGFSLDTGTFSPGTSWNRDVPWHLTASGSAQLLLTFPPNTIHEVGLFMTDGDTYWRSSIVQSNAEKQIASELHNGKWLFFRVFPDESAAGEKQFTFTQLTGNSVTVSALAAFE
ncbi:MAG: hypothetical protein KDD69_09735 [Bdellovibrionales bacterium]|nr:hypothetical protein [Bdellovibrionales bacterium]